MEARIKSEPKYMNFTGNLTRILILCICVFSYHSVTIFAASAAVSSSTMLDTFEEKKRSSDE